MKDGHLGGRNDKFSQRCVRKTSSKNNYISKLRDNMQRVIRLASFYMFRIEKLQIISLLFLYLSLCKIFTIVLVLWINQTLNLVIKILKFRIHAVFLVVSME